ncbi:autophagy protein 3 [Dictyostelium discoideum AX4]|uniref:Autophagy-related protein 3 n=1 Tax=Dictyostelium discoideum TaxID=44689 RepID=ATG3_DICDI|nr:autophagy protein 3 [Dictyostelium discoideum AX4]Q550A8.3 RecName: Full=Autophagy-related protein 3 [Dictyostelium discoideum]EAL68846.2 autophagy protein 3 [Dictyostelium discoideum AX4]|eukprot:XP_642708.2 autophagy protein 3 [Dictyostelium discoideum AX4]
MLTSFQQAVHKAYVKTVEKVTPTLSTSKFLEEGVLTPEEFVQAGDLLTDKCQTWTWESGDPSRNVSYLPKEKQFLLTRNVPCYNRVRTLENESKASKADEIQIEDDGEDSWVAPQPVGNQDDIEDEKVDISSLKIDDKKPNTTTTTTAKPTNNNNNNNDDEDEDEDGDIPDLDDFQDDNIIEEEDPAVLSKNNKTTTTTTANNNNNNNSENKVEDNDNILRTRTYDISITYDKYYQTPRVWLFGYDENRKPLKPEEIFEDISEDHAHKTVTIDSHPHLGISFAYIHPCRHAAVMKKLVDRQSENGKEPRVDQYLFLFLKFISVVIPTIEYDFTLEFDT